MTPDNFFTKHGIPGNCSGTFGGFMLMNDRRYLIIKVVFC